jgi:NAD(P)-dependent dehydrogenase (short-subunit alcohol dehydrogenase family)
VHDRFAAAQGLVPEVLLQRRRDGIPIGRFADIAEIAAAAAYLAEPHRPRPTVLAVTGGEGIG